MADIGRLPAQLLAYALAKLQPQETLRSCALVSSSFNKAAGLCISKIAVQHCSQAKAGALQSWLQTHGAAAVTSLQLSGAAFQPQPELLLPMQQLTALQSLELARLKAGPAPAAGDDGADNTPVLHPALSAALTSLQLYRCTVELQGLSALTKLRSLALSMPPAPEGEAASCVSVVAEAIPQLQQLTALDLRGSEVQDATLAQLKCLTQLQRLTLFLLGPSHDSPGGTLELPPSLTAVAILDDPDMPPPVYDSTSALTALTALEEAQMPGLGLNSRFQGGLAALATLTTLTFLAVRSCRLGTDGATLRVLTALTRLQFLRLCRQVGHVNWGLGAAVGTVLNYTAHCCNSNCLHYLCASMHMLWHCNLTHKALTHPSSKSNCEGYRVRSALTGAQLLLVYLCVPLTLLLCSLDEDVLTLGADYAALTSSPALECLELPPNIGPDAAQVMFTPQRQCSNLLNLLSLNVTWLAEDGAMAGLTAACPQLRHLGFSSLGGTDIEETSVTTWAAGLLRLTALRELTRLQVDTMDMQFAPPAFATLARLTGLKDLSITHLDSQYLGGLLRLTACRQLTQLGVTATAVDENGVPRGQSAYLFNHVSESVCRHEQSCTTPASQMQERFLWSNGTASADGRGSAGGEIIEETCPTPAYCLLSCTALRAPHRLLPTCPRMYGSKSRPSCCSWQRELWRLMRTALRLSAPCCRHP
jgi:hypothetical protein